jgi:hypothetical protein
MAAGYAALIKAIAGGVNGYLGGQAQNDVRAQIQGAYANLPPVPDLENEFLNGYLKQLQFTPQALALDRSLRSAYGPEDMQRAADLYSQFLPQFANANLRTLNRVDPQFTAGRQQLYNTVAGDLADGSGLDPAFRDQLNDYLRGAQAARGNILGNAPVAAEALYQGQAGQAMKQQRIENMLKFLTSPGPEEKFGGLAGGGATALGPGLAAETNPAYSYIQGPKDWGNVYFNAAQDEFQDADTQALARARALASAPPETNPWLTSFAGGLSALGSSFGGGGSSGGGGSFSGLF